MSSGVTTQPNSSLTCAAQARGVVQLQAVPLLPMLRTQHACIPTCDADVEDDLCQHLPKLIQLLLQGGVALLLARLLHRGTAAVQRQLRAAARAAGCCLPAGVHVPAVPARLLTAMSQPRKRNDAPPREPSPGCGAAPAPTWICSWIFPISVSMPMLLVMHSLCVLACETPGHAVWHAVCTGSLKNTPCMSGTTPLSIPLFLCACPALQ